METPEGWREASTDPAGGATDSGEANLLARARKGDLPAFEQIVRMYQRRVYGVAFRIVRRHDVADDVTQEAFLRAYRALRGFDLTRPFGPWISRIAANLAVNQVRSPRWREQELPGGLAETPSRAEGPLDRLLEREGQAVLERAVEALPAEQRAVFVLRAVEEMSYQQISEALQLSPGTVMSRLSRAREKLRQALRPYLGTLSPGAGGGGP